MLLLKRTFNRQQWGAIALLAFGLAIVQQTGAQRSNRRGLGLEVGMTGQDVTSGFLLMMGASALSGFAGVYTERVLKYENDFWATNFHMSLFSLVPASFILITSRIKDDNFEMMQGFGGWALAAVILNAVGGLLVS